MKKLISLFLAALLLFSGLPTAVFAAEVESAPVYSDGAGSVSADGGAVAGATAESAGGRRPDGIAGDRGPRD